MKFTQQTSPFLYHANLYTQLKMSYNSTSNRDRISSQKKANVIEHKNKQYLALQGLFTDISEAFNHCFKPFLISIVK